MVGQLPFSWSNPARRAACRVVQKCAACYRKTESASEVLPRFYYAYAQAELRILDSFSLNFLTRRCRGLQLCTLTSTRQLKGSVTHDYEVRELVRRPR